MTAYDVVPSLLAFLGLPIPHDTDGKVIEIVREVVNKRPRTRDYFTLWQALRRVKMKIHCQES